MRGLLTVVLAALLLAGCARERAEPAGLAPPERERAIPAGVDTSQIAQLRARAAAQRARAPAANLYHLAKAEAWIDFGADAGLDESSVDTADAALREAALLLAGLERGAPLMYRTLHVLASQRVRGDLWGLVDGMKESAGFRCASEPLARAEVTLVWAGHRAFMGDRNRSAEIEARAEWFLDAARGEFRRCIAEQAAPPRQAAPAPTTPVAPVVPVPAPARPAPAAAARGHIEVVQLRTDALFVFGSAALDTSRSQAIRDLAQRIRTIANIVSVRVHGHTDRLSQSGPAFNLRLSESRARAVRDALVAQGVDARLIETRGHGDAKPVADCPGPRDAALVDCLAPNRRVEIEIERAH